MIIVQHCSLCADLFCPSDFSAQLQIPLPNLFALTLDPAPISNHGTPISEFIDW